MLVQIQRWGEKKTPQSVDTSALRSFALFTNYSPRAQLPWHGSSRRFTMKSQFEPKEWRLTSYEDSFRLLFLLKQVFS